MYIYIYIRCKFTPFNYMLIIYTERSYSGSLSRRKPGESNSLCPLKVRDNLVDGELLRVNRCRCKQNGGSNGRSIDRSIGL